MGITTVPGASYNARLNILYVHFFHESGALPQYQLVNMRKGYATVCFFGCIL